MDDEGWLVKTQDFGSDIFLLKLHFAFLYFEIKKMW